MTNPKRRDNINVLQGVLKRRITKFIQPVIKLENSRIVFQENLTEMRLLTKSVLTTFLHLLILSTTLRGVDHIRFLFSFLETRGINLAFQRRHSKQAEGLAQQKGSWLEKHEAPRNEYYNFTPSWMGW